MTDIGPFTRAELPNGGVIYARASDHSYWTEIHEKAGKWTAVQASRLASVTTVLGVLSKDGLLDWAARLAREGEDWREVRNQGGERGTSAHDLILRTLLQERTSLADLAEEHRPWGQAAFAWLADRKPDVIAAECFVASWEYRYAGRFDLLATLHGQRTRVDFKTVSRWAEDKKGRRYPPYPENVLQLDLYEHAAIESGYESAERGLIVRLGPDGTYDETPVALEPERGLKALGAYRAKSEAGKCLRAVAA